MRLCMLDFASDLPETHDKEKLKSNFGVVTSRGEREGARAIYAVRNISGFLYMLV